MAAKKKINYSSTSPYSTTGVYRLGLDVAKHRSIPRFATDKTYVIEPQYDMKPGHLAHYLYGTTKLWWVFAARNPTILKDPLFGFKTGTRIFIPSKKTLRSALGV